MTYSIGQVAKAVGLPSKTIRFYEDSGIIAPAARTENGYRSYSKSAIEELKVIKYARDLGLPLHEIKKLMQGCELHGCHHSKDYLHTYIGDYLSLIDGKIQELEELKTRLENFRFDMSNEQCNPGDEYCCNIFHQIVTKSLNGKGGDKV